MPHESIELALVAIDASAQRRDRGERIGAAAGPGWFESSWELHRGLEVCESWPDDDRVRGWVEEFLFAQRTIGRTASPSASTAIA